MEEEYFVVAVFGFVSQLESNGGGGFTFDQVTTSLQAKYLEKGAKFERSLPLLRQAMERLVELGALNFFPDFYAGDHYASRGNIPAMVVKLRQESAIYRAYSAMGRTSDAWLASALKNIELRVASSTEPAAESKSVVPADEDRWEPLQLSIEDERVAEAIAGAEQAVSAIRADNGFAASLPGERDDLVGHAEATVAAARAGVVTKRQLRENLVAAGKWLMDKFGGTAIGTVGGELVKWGLRLLGLLP